LVALVLLLAAAPPAGAHQIDTSYLTVIVRPDTLRLVLVIDESILLRGFQFDRNNDRTLWREEMLAGVPEVFDYAASHMTLQADGQMLPLERVSGNVQPDNDGNMYISVLWHCPLRQPIVDLGIGTSFADRFGTDHKVLVKVLRQDQPMVQAVLNADTTVQPFHVGEPSQGVLDQIERWFR
jgi:hypothetical protein